MGDVLPLLNLYKTSPPLASTVSVVSDNSVRINWTVQEYNSTRYHQLQSPSVNQSTYLSSNNTNCHALHWSWMHSPTPILDYINPAVTGARRSVVLFLCPVRGRYSSWHISRSDSIFGGLIEL